MTRYPNTETRIPPSTDPTERRHRRTAAFVMALTEVVPFWIFFLFSFPIWE
jgi:hypothetical protein